MQITIIQGDITELDVDAIVNAANSSLLGGGGVDGAIHRGAGPGLLKECRTLGGCPTGEARITGGYNLKAQYIIHTVGPVWQGGKAGEANLLQSAYKSSLKLADQNHLKRIAFPAISTGIYGYPKEEAAQLAIASIQDFAQRQASTLEEVILVGFDANQTELYKQVLDKQKEHH